MPLLLVAVLVILALATAWLSYDQSRTRGSTVGMVYSCSKKVGTKPNSYVLSCADANSMLASLHWLDWGDATAYATGTAKWNDCTPTCVAGHWKSEPVTVWAWRIRDDRYTRLATSDPRLAATIDLAPYPG